MVEQVQQADIFKYALTQTKMWLSSEYEKYSGNKVTAKIVTGPAALRQISAALSKPDSDEVKQAKLSYPYLLFAIGDISLDGERNGFNKYSYRQTMQSKDLDAGTAKMLNLRPVKIALGISFNTDSITEIINFTHALLMNAPKVQLLMEASDSNFRIASTLEIDGSFSTPPVNYETPGDGYQYEGLLILNTYIGVVDTMRLIRKVKFTASNYNTEDTFFEGEPEDIVFSEVRDFTDLFKKNGG